MEKRLPSRIYGHQASRNFANLRLSQSAEGRLEREWAKKDGGRAGEDSDGDAIEPPMATKKWSIKRVRRETRGRTRADAPQDSVW